MKEKLVAAPRFCNSLSRPSPLISSLFLRIEYISVTKSAVAMGGLLFGGMSDPLFRTLLKDDFARSYSVADLLNVDFLFTTKSAVAMGGLLFGGMSDPLFRTLLKDDFARSYSVADLLNVDFLFTTKSAVAMGGLLFGGMSDPLFRTLLKDDFARSYSVADLLNVDFLFRMFPLMFFNFPLDGVAICPRSPLPFLNFFSVGPLSLLIFENTGGRSTGVSFCFDGNYAFYRYGTGAGRVKTKHK